MNTYAKYTANVFVAKCPDRHERGEVITVQTKYGKEHECIVFNLVAKIEGFYYYSIVRADGFNMQEYARRKAERYAQWAASAEIKSDDYRTRLAKDKDFLSLGEPIKIGHHSENRHRRIIEQARSNFGKSVELTEKADRLTSRSEYWASKESDINLSMPESIEYYEYKLEEARERHEGLKSGKYPREHSYSLTYAKKAVNEMEKNLETARKLWG